MKLYFFARLRVFFLRFLADFLAGFFLAKSSSRAATAATPATKK